LAAKIRADGFKVSILDETLLQESKTTLIDYLTDVSIVGISGHITQHNIMLQTAKKVKEINSSIINVLGGPHPTLTKALLMKDANVDFIIQGEGEIAFSELINRLEENRPIKDIAGLIFREKGNVQINPPKDIENLDELPIPAFDLSKLDEYYELFMKKFDTLGNITYPRAYRIPVESSRGCPVACNFCCAKTVIGSTWRAKSPTRLLEEISRIEELFPKIFNLKETYLTYVDNNFTTSKKRVKEFCRLKKESKYDISWAALSRATEIDYELVKIMVDAGFTATFIGGESGNLNSLIHMGKKYKDDSTINAVKACIKAEVKRIIVSFIVGLPYEDISAIKKTLKYAYDIRELAPRNVIISVYKATPYPSTSFWGEMEEAGKLSPDFEKYDLLLKEGLVFDHPIFGFEAVELDKLLNLWNSISSLKYLNLSLIDQQFKPLQIVRPLQYLLKRLKSMGINPSLKISSVTQIEETQLIQQINNQIRELEEFIFK